MAGSSEPFATVATPVSGVRLRQLDRIWLDELQNGELQLTDEAAHLKTTLKGNWSVLAEDNLVMLIKSGEEGEDRICAVVDSSIVMRTCYVCAWPRTNAMSMPTCAFVDSSDVMRTCDVCAWPRTNQLVSHNFISFKSFCILAVFGEAL